MLLREPKLKITRDAGGVAGVELATSLQLRIYGRMFTVKRGFISDGMSIPWLFRPLIGDPFEQPYVYGAIIHDYHYRTQEIDRNLADTIFRSILKKSGVPPWKCSAIYLALRLFGWTAWRSNRKKFITKKGH
jgi:hypothetical protein